MDGASRQDERTRRITKGTWSIRASGARKEHHMSGTLIDLIIQIVAGVIGGHAAGATLKNYTLGAIGNTIAGAIGGVAGVQLLAQMMPALASTAGNVDASALVGQVIGG